MNPEQPPASIDLSRRQFIRLGLVGGAVIASGATLSGLSGCSRRADPAEGFRHLRPADLALLAPLVPVLLAGAFEMNDASVRKALQGMDTLLDYGAPGARADVFELLDFLQLAPARWFLTGSWQSFETMDEAQAREAVAHWAGRDRGLSRLALRALAAPLQWAWYMTPEGSRASGYPGPPQQVSA